MFAFICLVLIPSIFAKVELQTVYSLQVEIFRNDEVVLKDISSENGFVSSFPTTSRDYSIKVLGKNDKVLFDRDIEVSFVLNLEPIKTIQLKSSVVHLRVPYFENAERIKIFHNSKEIFSIDLSEEVCNNNLICEVGENENNCPGDCSVKKEFPISLFILFVVILTLGIAFLISKIKRKSI